MRFAMPLPWKSNPEMPGPLKKRAEGLRAWLSKPRDDRFKLFNTNQFLWRVRQARLKPPDSQSGDRRFKSDTRCQIFIRNCGREVRHLIVDQVDDGSSPFSSAMRQ